MDDKLRNIIQFFLKKFFPSASDEVTEHLLQFMKFGLIGVSNTVVSYLLNVAVLMALAPMKVSWDFIVGNIVAFVLSVLWSFYWNSRFVFTVKDGKKRSAFLALDSNIWHLKVFSAGAKSDH